MKFRIFTVFVCIFVFLSYIIALAIYLFPLNPATLHIKSKVTYFMDRFFYQDWHLFSPDPSQRTVQMYIKCGKSRNADWFNPIQRLQKAHEGNRFSLKSLYYRQYNYIVTELRSSYRLTRARAINKREGFDKMKSLAIRFSGDMCLYKTNKVASVVQFKIVSFHPKQYSQKNIVSPNRVYTSKTFGPYIIKERKATGNKER